MPTGLFASHGAKRSGRPASVNAVSGQTGNLLHVWDTKTKRRYLVDGGALLSILPPTSAQRVAGPNGTQLKAANGTIIKCYGTSKETVTIGNQAFLFEFTIADVKQPILGADFLANFSLAPNHRDGSLINLDTLSTLPATLAKGVPSNPINYVDIADDPYYKVLHSFPSILTPNFRVVEPKHGVRHHIPTSGRPVQSRARPLNPEKLAVAKAELEKLVKLGICHRGKSEWSSPLMVAKKPCLSPCSCTASTPCGGWRVCGDYRRLNSQTTDDKYPVRSIRDFTADLHGKKIFSKIDLMKGYHQIPVAKDDIGKTGVITPFGLYVFPCTPFGLKNAGQDFQRLMDEILGDVPRVFVYIDDLLIASETPEQHIEDLKTVCKILEDNGLAVNYRKCVLGKSELEFLGYSVNAGGIAPLPERVEAIRKFPTPKSVKDLQRFLGMLNYYRRFIQKAAKHLYFLFNALKGKEKGKAKILNWTPDCQTSFDAAKEALASATLLHHPRPKAPLALTTDASKFAVGGVLEQRGPAGWEPLAYYSSKLQDNQVDWPPYDRELLAAFKCVRHFRPFIEGKSFTIYTDHQSLVPSMAKKSDPQTARQTYQLACISEYSTDIRYIEGKANVVADNLSRPPMDEPTVSNINKQEQHVFVKDMVESGIISEPKVNSIVPTTTAKPKPVAETSTEDLNVFVSAITQAGFDLKQMAADQAIDPEYRQLATDARTGLQFRKINIDGTDIIVDVSNGPARPFVPFNWRRQVFETVHNLGHPGVERTRKTIAAKFVWPSLRQDTSRWARECRPCQRAKVTRNTIQPFGDFVVPQKRFEHINLDIVTLPPSNGFKYLLTAVDRFSRWPVAVPMQDTQTETVIDAFAHGWVAHFGVPSSITTDRGAQFTSEIWKQLTKMWGIKNHLTTSYHPASNGLVERFHRRLKEALLATDEQNPNEWYWRLPCVLLAIRTTLKPDIAASPADLVFGEGLSIPGDAISGPPPSDEELNRLRQATLSSLRLEVARLRPTPTSAHCRPRVHIPNDLRTTSHVMIRRGGVQPSFTTPFTGPYRVISREESSFQVALPNGTSDSVSISRLKPAIMANEEENAEESQSNPPLPPARGSNPLAYDPGEGTSRQARARTRSISSEDENDDDNFEQFLTRMRNSRRNANPNPTPAAVPVPTPAVESPDPFDGHTPQDPNLAACQCDPPSCDVPLPQAASQPQSNRNIPTPPPPSAPTINPVPANVAPSNPVPLSITPHPRHVQDADLNRRQHSRTRPRPNYGPSLSAIMKSYLGM